MQSKQACADMARGPCAELAHKMNADGYIYACVDFNTGECFIHSGGTPAFRESIVDFAHHIDRTITDDHTDPNRSLREQLMRELGIK